MKTNLFFAVTVFLFITSCRKEKTTNQNLVEPYIQFSAAALAWVQLPPHKYFIYKDSATGTLDSVVVTKSDIEKSYSPSQNFGWGNSASYYYQYFTLGLTKFSGTTSQYWFYGAAFSYTGSGPIVQSSDSAGLGLNERDTIEKV